MLVTIGDSYLRELDINFLEYKLDLLYLCAQFKVGKKNLNEDMIGEYILTDDLRFLEELTVKIITSINGNKEVDKYRLALSLFYLTVFGGDHEKDIVVEIGSCDDFIDRGVKYYIELFRYIIFQVDLNYGKLGKKRIQLLTDQLFNFTILSAIYKSLCVVDLKYESERNKYFDISNLSKISVGDRGDLIQDIENVFMCFQDEIQSILTEISLNRAFFGNQHISCTSVQLINDWGRFARKQLERAKSGNHKISGHDIMALKKLTIEDLLVRPNTNIYRKMMSDAVDSLPSLIGILSKSDLAAKHHNKNSRNISLEVGLVYRITYNDFEKMHSKFSCALRVLFDSMLLSIEDHNDLELVN